jgi:hypothetical protein
MLLLFLADNPSLANILASQKITRPVTTNILNTPAQDIANNHTQPLKQETSKPEKHRNISNIKTRVVSKQETSRQETSKREKHRNESHIKTRNEKRETLKH